MPNGVVVLLGAEAKDGFKHIQNVAVTYLVSQLEIPGPISNIYP